MHVNINSTADGQANWDMLSREERHIESAKTQRKVTKLSINILSFSNFRHYPPAPAIPWH